jgi:hypothetical protein
MAAHTHDCDACRYLGTAILMGRTWDFYSCVGDLPGGSIIARYGNDGEEYSSALIHLIKPDVNKMGQYWGPVYRYGLSLL